jgi:ABC-type bacteriocin/lantibiotic exporter with double-glycine peptidase domain
MLSIQQYKKLQEYKELGLSKVKVSEKLNLSYKTICNWWDKDQAFFNAFQKNHEYVLDNYRQYIIEILKISPQINNTVLYKRIKDDFSEFDVQSSSFFKYVKEVREQTGLLNLNESFKLEK